jgi:hypothetical protein
LKIQHLKWGSSLSKKTILADRCDHLTLELGTEFLSRRTFLTIFLLLFVLLTGLVPYSASQTFHGTVDGTVLDPKGAPISGATVTLTNVGTGVKKITQTSDSGSYQFLELVPGEYEIEASQEGFAHLKKGPFPVQVQAAVRLDLELKVGSVSETITVSSEAPLLQSESAAVSQVVEERTVQQMPLNGRNVMNLVALVPGVVPQGGSGVNLTNQNLFSAGNFQVDGGAANQSASFLDGAPVNTNYGNLTALVPTQDSIGQFRVVTNNDGPEFGRYTGGVVNFTTKSGTNTIHGSAYEFLRNKVLNANNFFSNAAGVPTPAFTQNQFGVNAGGPIIKDKLFLFGSYEGFRLRQGVTYVETVPTAAERAGDFSGLTDANGKPVTIYNPFTTCGQYVNPACGSSQTVLRTAFPGNIIPSNLISPASKTLIAQTFPDPNTAGVNGVNNYIADASAGGGNDQYSFRGDYSISPTQTLFARYTRWTLSNLAQDPYHNGTCFDSGQCPEGFLSQQAALGYTILFGPNKVLDLRGSYLYFNYARNSPTLGYDLTQLGWPSILNSQLQFRSLPGLSLPGYGVGASISIIAKNNIYSFIPSFTWTLGKHTLKFGGEARRLDFTSLQDGGPSGTYNFDSLATSSNPFLTTDTGNSVASFLLGTGNSGSVGVPVLTHNRMWYGGMYASDSWRVTNKLTLNLGLRWELPGAWTERTNSIANFDPTLPVGVGIPGIGGLALVDSINSPGPYLTKYQWNLFGPRVGAAYSLRSNTVLRVGYGIFFIPADVYYFESPFNNPVNLNVNSWNATSNGELSFNTLFTNPFPNGLVPAPGREPNFQPYGQQIAAPLYNEPFGNTQQWNVSLQHQFRGNASLDVAYVGSKGTHLPMQEGNLNAIPDQYLSMGSALLDPVTNPYYGAITAGPLSGPTIPEGQLLRPFPQYLNVIDMGHYYGNSIYNSLQVKAQKQFSRSGSILAAYTWSKSISDTDTSTWWLENGFTAFPQDYSNLKADRSLSAFDTPQRLVISYVYDLPIGKGQRFLADANGVVGKIVSGWGINGITVFQSGFPLHFTVASSQLTQLGGGAEQFGIPVIRPDYVAGCDKTVSGSATARLNEWFNTACFVQPAPFAYGNESRVDPTLRSQGIINFDFSLFKQTAITERVNLEFRTEFFNLFNRVQFAPPGMLYGVPTFGVVSAQANNPRLIQFGLRLNF